jgi:hypothetical protein
MNPTNRLDPYFALPAPRTAVEVIPRASSQPAVKVKGRAATVEILALWRETLVAFSARSGLVLACALVGFVSYGALAQSFSVLTGRGPDSNLWPFAFCGTLGLLLDALARGVLAWVGLQDPRTSTRGLLRLTLGRWRELLAGSLVHAALMLACALGGTALFVIGGLGVVDPEPSPPDLDSVPRLAVARSIDALLLGPVQPLSELVTPARLGALRLVWQSDSPAPVELKWLAFRYGGPVSTPVTRDSFEPVAMLPVGLVAFGSLALLFATETLLRFRAAAAMRSDPARGAAQCGILAPIVESARLGLRHYGPVVASTWSLRLLASAVRVACIILPGVVAENAVFPQLAGIAGAAWIAPACRLASALGGALVGAVLAAFCTLYDARLFVALQRGERGGYE